ncbi:hypothetical protein SBOR_9059 [Sclerotinia borealis F-4128]|uniref:Uncharacterized protein n=1 Tax=Sclerotinia borealis (strain F-4128) TaxID=1432307 RepID=W9C176_SCLBF|nr:hypothetical protein SBOR_9059 [Sclerotinia borealis F-4128]
MSAPVPSKTQFQARKLRSDRSVETVESDKGALMGRITDKDFGIKLQQNNIIYTSLDARAPDDIDGVRELLDQRRDSEPPELLDYQRYLVVTEDYENELGVEISAYPLLAKRTLREVEISGYFRRPNHAWSAVDNHLTMGLSDPQPDLVESYRMTDYPSQAAEALSADLAPSSYNEAMPAYAVQFKSSNGDMKEAKLQCVFGGSVVTEGARGAHTYMHGSNVDFYGKTQAITIAFNGGLIEYYAHHALQTPGPSQLAAYGAAPNEVAAVRAEDTVKYHSYLLDYDYPRASLRSFQSAYKHMRNAQDIGYKWSTERKDALWAYTNGDNAQTSPDVAPSAQQLTDPLIPVSLGPLDGNHDAHDDEMDPTDQLVKESRADKRYASSDTKTHNPITPPQSSKDVSVPLNSQQLSVTIVTGPEENV